MVIKMQGKIIAKVKDEHMAEEKQEMFTSLPGATMEEFKLTIKEAGCNPDNYNYTDPLPQPTEPVAPEISEEFSPLLKVRDPADSLVLELQIMYYAKELGLNVDMGKAKAFLQSGVNMYLNSIPGYGKHDPVDDLPTDEDVSTATLEAAIKSEPDEPKELEKAKEEAEVEEDS